MYCQRYGSRLDGVLSYTLAALTAVDPELYESARIDGAGRWRQTWNITLPSILPTIMILLILRIGTIMNVGFEKVMLLYNPSIYQDSGRYINLCI